ncbi:MAG TPA: hypothetical protein DIT99_18920, partial [Candidatus Latescibacteria bacterium]|nr:hypothetical protein [Candidatus Latescibacterota bacterium]
MFRRDHGCEDAPGEKLAVIGDAVVVFAGSDIAGAAGEVNVGHVTVLHGATIAGQPDEFGGDDAGAVHAGRVDRVVMQDSDGRVVVPEANGFQHGIDQTFGSSTNR